MARRKAAGNPLDAGPELDELQNHGTTDGEGADDDGEGADDDGDAGEEGEGSAAASASGPDAAPEPDAAPPPAPAPLSAAAGAARVEDPPELDEDDVALVRVGYPVLCRRTGRTAPSPALVVEVHDDRSLDLVVFHQPTWVNGLPVCSTFLGRVPRARDEDPEAPGWLPLYLV